MSSENRKKLLLEDILKAKKILEEQPRKPRTLVVVTNDPAEQVEYNRYADVEVYDSNGNLIEKPKIK